MAQVKLEEEQELLEPAEEEHSVFMEFKQEPDLRDVPRVQLKEEPEEVEIKAEPLEFPLIHKSVKREEEEALVKEESRKDTYGAGLEKLPESEEHGANCSDTDDSEDWAPSAERPAPQTHSEGNREESAGEGCSSDSESSFEFDAPTKTPARTKRKMEDYSVFSKGTILEVPPTAREGPHICSICDKSFTQMGAVSRHMMTHTGEKPYTCPFCCMDFNQLGNLKRHVRSHTGERLFKCLICEKDFTCKRNLKRHMTIHSQEKPS